MTNEATPCMGGMVRQARRRRRKMSRKKAYGATSLDYLKGRCRVDAETGCWVWAGCFTQGTSRVVAPAGVLGPQRVPTSAHRLAWHFAAGEAPKPGQLLYRRVGCEHDMCINPGHRALGDRSDAMQAAAARGSFDTVARIASRRRGNLANAVCAQTVAAVEAALAGGATIKAAAALVGVNADTASAIANGRHIRQRSEVRGASVFSWGGVA